MMPKIRVGNKQNSFLNGEWAGHVHKSNEQMDKVRANFAKMKADKKERMQKRFDEIPAINWEILKYANHHDKDECLLKYPEHEKFVNSITFNR